MASDLLSLDSDGAPEPALRVMKYAAGDFADTSARAALLDLAAKTTPDWADYAHLGLAATTRQPYWPALAVREPGVHLLLFGPRGTGKTELAKTLAQHTGVPLYPVVEADHAGGEPK
jgi:hypothetical protein